MSILQNPYISGMISLCIALYAVFIAPGLPNKVLGFFDTVFGKLFFLFLVAYVASEGNIQVSIMIAVALAITLIVIGENKMKESFRNSFYEHFTVEEKENNLPPNSRVRAPNTKDHVAYQKIRGSNFETHMNLEDYAPVHFPNQEHSENLLTEERRPTRTKYETNQELQAHSHTEFPKYV